MKKIITTISIALVVIICSQKIIFGQGFAGILKMSAAAQSASVNNKSVQGDSKKMLESISNKIIRFHVIANSDSEKDQNLKLKVKDAIIKYLFPKLNDSKSIAQSRKILEENDKKIKEIALKVINDNGYDYKVSSTLSRENFPVKTYGNITLPEGNYEAYRVIIGNGQGKNWWCVMFPPLCFIDVTKANVSEDKTKASMERVLTDDEYNFIDNSKDTSSNKPKIQYRFKIVDIIDNLIKKFHL